MKNHRHFSSHSAGSIICLIVGIVILSGCETSRVEPELPTPNPAPSATQPLILSGYVRDAATGSAILTASVKIQKYDGTLLATVVSDKTGKYSFDATEVTDIALLLIGNKEGYGYDTKVADINKNENSAIVTDILLTKLQISTAPITTGNGGQTSTQNPQSVSKQPLTVSVPPGAVLAPVNITASAIPAGRLPTPLTETGTSIQSAGQFGPSGTQFQQPVIISFPLPSPQPVGKTYPLLQLNEQTGSYTNSGFTATVNPDGTTASAAVTHFTVYAISEKATLNLTDGVPTTGSSAYLELASGSVVKTFASTNTFSATGTGAVNESWLKDIIAAELKIDFSATSTAIGGNMIPLPQSSHYQINGVQSNPKIAGKGNWVYRWFVLKQTVITTGTASGSGWSRNIYIVKEKWINDNTKTGWYWISHDQGGALSGPY